LIKIPGDLKQREKIEAVIEFFEPAPYRKHLVGDLPYGLRKLEKSKQGEFVFAGHAPGRPLSNMAMEMLLRRMNVDVTVHGFRSSFRDWAGNETPSPREVVETALAHVVGDKAEQVYRRSDALDKRRKLMEAWANYCEPKASGTVVQLVRKNKK